MKTYNHKAADSTVVRIPRDLDDKLGVLADKTGRKKIFYIKAALTRYLEDMEDYYLAIAAKEEMKGKDWVKHEELKKELGLDD